MKIINSKIVLSLFLLLNCLVMQGMFLQTVRKQAPRTRTIRSPRVIAQPVKRPVFIPQQPSLGVRLMSFIPFTSVGLIRKEAIEFFEHIQAADESIIRNPQTGKLEYAEKDNKYSISQEEFINARLIGEVITRPMADFKNFIKKFEQIVFKINPSFDKQGTTTLAFSKQDLKEAEGLLVLNKQFINKNLSPEYFVIDWQEHGISKFKDLQQLKLADKILTVILDESLFMGQGLSSLSAKVNLAELLLYIAGLNGTITSDNIPYFKKKYLSDLMETYKKIYSDPALDSYKKEIEKLFLIVDPVMKILMPELKETVSKASEERKKIKISVSRKALLSKSSHE